MIFNLFRKPEAPDAAAEAYRAIVAQSRQPRFYADWGVPDTVTGRFDMISLHLTLLLHRLRSDESAKLFTQALVDLFFKDMDRSLRELGAGDLSVPKKIRKMTEIFYALMAGINEAIDRGDQPGVESVLKRNVLADADTSHVAELAAYLFAQADSLSGQPLDAIAGGRIEMAAAA